MARPLRIEYEGAFYHVTSRGNDRKKIFLSPKKMRSCSNAIYGPRIKGNYPSRALGRTLARRRFIPIGDGSNRRTLIYYNLNRDTSHFLYERINVGGTATVVKAAVEAGVKRLVFFSTIAVYGNSNGQILTEETPAKLDTFYARTKLAAERIVLDAKRADGQPLGTVLRFAAIYGPRIKGNYHRLVQALARRRFIPIGDGSNRRTLIYDRDVAKAALLAVQHPNSAGKVYNVSDGHFHTLKGIITAICQALGRTPPRFSVPVGPARFFAGLLEDTLRLVGWKSPISRETIDKYTEDISVDSQLIQEELGFVPKFGLSAGWKDTVQEMPR